MFSLKRIQETYILTRNNAKLYMFDGHWTYFRQNLHERNDKIWCMKFQYCFIFHVVRLDVTGKIMKRFYGIIKTHQPTSFWCSFYSFIYLNFVVVVFKWTNFGDMLMSQWNHAWCKENVRDSSMFRDQRSVVVGNYFFCNRFTSFYDIILIRYCWCYRVFLWCHQNTTLFEKGFHWCQFCL